MCLLCVPRGIMAAPLISGGHLVETKKTQIICCLSVKIHLYRGQMAAILNYTYNAMTDVVYGHASILCVTEKTKIDTKNINLLQFGRKW